MKTLALLLLSMLLCSAQSVVIYETNGTMSLRPAYPCRVAVCETATAVTGPWFTSGVIIRNEERPPTDYMFFHLPRTSEPTRFWRLRISTNTAPPYLAAPAPTNALVTVTVK